MCLRPEDPRSPKRVRYEAPAFVPPQPLTPKVVALDLDETTGSWAMGSLIFSIYKSYADHPPPVDLFVEHYLEVGGARPGLREFLQRMETWKASGRIDRVVVFTAASNATGWVTFLMGCMEHYANTPGLFQGCIVREQCPRALDEDGNVRVLKDLAQLSGDPYSVVLIDDKPRLAINGLVIGVPEYRKDVCHIGAMRMLQVAFPVHAEAISQHFEDDQIKHPPNGLDYSLDDALLGSIQVLENVFPVD